MPRVHRVSLIGSEELFRPTRPAAEEAALEAGGEEPDAEALISHRQAHAEPVPLPREKVLYRLQLTAEQIKILLEAVRRMKYPHSVRTDHKPSLEEFEDLEAVKAALLDSLE